MFFARPARLSSALLAAVALTGCNVGPKYTRPTVPTAPDFRGADNTSISSDPATSLGDKKWAEVFREPELQQLITTALANNLDLRVAAERVLEQQQQVRITRAQEFPSINAGGTGVGADLGNSGALGNNISSPLSFGSFNFSAAWSPDFWGIYRKQTQQQRDLLLAQEWAQRAVRLSLVQQVATTYFQLRSLDDQLAISQRTLKVRQDSLKLTQTLEQGGAAPLSDVRQAEQLLYTATSTIPQLEQQIQQAENSLRLLLGQAPGPVAHTDPDALAPPPTDLPTGIPLPAPRAPARHPAGRGPAPCRQRRRRHRPRPVLPPGLHQRLRRPRRQRVLQPLRPQRPHHLRLQHPRPAHLRRRPHLRPVRPLQAPER